MKHCHASLNTLKTLGPAGALCFQNPRPLSWKDAWHKASCRNGCRLRSQILARSPLMKLAFFLRPKKATKQVRKLCLRKYQPFVSNSEPQWTNFVESINLFSILAAWRLYYSKPTSFPAFLNRAQILYIYIYISQRFLYNNSRLEESFLDFFRDLDISRSYKGHKTLRRSGCFLVKSILVNSSFFYMHCISWVFFTPLILQLKSKSMSSLFCLSWRLTCSTPKVATRFAAAINREKRKLVVK